VVVAAVFMAALNIGRHPPAKLWRPEKSFSITENIQIAEAQAWWQGRLDLPERKWDSALHNGRVYSHFPPMFSLISAVLVPLFDGVPHWCIVLTIVLPVPVLAYALFWKRTGSVGWAITLAIGFVCGTSALPVLDGALRGAHPYVVNQSLSMIGLLVLLIEATGRRRVGVMGSALIVAALARQLTIAYAIPLAYLALRREGTGSRAGRLAFLMATAFVVVAVPCVLNTLKFQNPLDSGYMYIYNDRPEDAFSRDAERYGLFSAHYVPRNLYFANLGFPRVNRIEREGREETYLRPNHMGTGIWWTTPLLCLLFVDVRRIWADGLSRAMLLAAVLAYVGLMVYHSTGFDQRGYNRYSLDYIPVLFALLAPRCTTGRRRWFALVAIAWSLVYFVVLMPMPHWGPF
jgi:hypothetical protein